MDRQAAKVEERLDAVKEYVRFRKLPRDLALRVKKHYSFYFTHRSGFDEARADLCRGQQPHQLALRPPVPPSPFSPPELP